MTPKNSAPLLSLGKAVAKSLNAQRAYVGMTQMQLSEKSGISQSQLSKQLRGIRAINIDELDAICEALGVSMESILESAEAALDRRPIKTGPKLVSSRSTVSDHDDLIARINSGEIEVAAQEATDPLEENQP